VDRLIGGDGMLLEKMAEEANPALPDFLDAHRGEDFNVVTVDWYGMDHSDGAPVPLIVAMN
jgi:hypothetical protein